MSCSDASTITASDTTAAAADDDAAFATAFTVAFTAADAAAASEKKALRTAAEVFTEQLSSVNMHYDVFKSMVDYNWPPSERQALPKGELEVCSKINELALQCRNDVRALCESQLEAVDVALMRFDDETAENATQASADDRALLRTTPPPELLLLTALSDVATFELLRNAVRGLQKIDGVHETLLEMTDAGFFNSASRVGIVMRLFPESMDETLLQRSFHVAAKNGNAEVMRSLAADGRLAPHLMTYANVIKMADDALRNGQAAVLALLFRYNSSLASVLFSSHCYNAECLKVLLDVQYQDGAEEGLMARYRPAEVLGRVLHRATPLRYTEPSASTAYSQATHNTAQEVAAAQELACVLARDVGIRGTMTVDEIHRSVFWYAKEDALAGAVEHLLATPSFAKEEALIRGQKNSLKDAVLEGRPNTTRALMRDPRITQALVDDAESVPAFLFAALGLRLRQARAKAAFPAEQRASLDCALADPLISTAYDAYVHRVLEQRRATRDTARQRLEAFQIKCTSAANPADAADSTKSSVGPRRASRQHPPTDEEAASIAASLARGAEEAGLRLDASSAEKAYAVVQCEYDRRIRETVAAPVALAGQTRKRQRA